MGWSVAVRELWKPTVFGLIVIASYGRLSPGLAVWSLPLTAGFLLAVPLAVLTSAPWFGAWLVRHKLCAVPEELDVPDEIRALRSEETRAIAPVDERTC